jgi:hypothetical protein
MAYTLTDYFRPLRLTLRINGLGIGGALGLCLLATPKSTLAIWGLYSGGAIWPMRLAGALLISLGLVLLLAASQTTIPWSVMLVTTVANSLVAGVLLIAYFQQELTGLSLVGRLLLIVVFILCLVGAVTPLRYLRTDYAL